MDYAHRNELRKLLNTPKFFPEKYRNVNARNSEQKSNSKNNDIPCSDDVFESLLHSATVDTLHLEVIYVDSYYKRQYGQYRLEMSR
jgi:hypothetical protein